MFDEMMFAVGQFAALALVLSACWGIGHHLLRFVASNAPLPEGLGVLSTGTMLSAMLSQVCGAILHTVTLGRQEAKRLVYLSIPLAQ